MVEQTERVRGVGLTMDFIIILLILLAWGLHRFENRLTTLAPPSYITCLIHRLTLANSWPRAVHRDLLPQTCQSQLVEGGESQSVRMHPKEVEWLDSVIMKRLSLH